MVIWFTLGTKAARLEACLSDISDRMKTNMLKINQDKTELIIVSLKKNNYSVFPNCTINFDGLIIEALSSVKYLGVLFDRCLGMEDAIHLVSKQCLYNITTM